MCNLTIESILKLLAISNSLFLPLVMVLIIMVIDVFITKKDKFYTKHRIKQSTRFHKLIIVGILMSIIIAILTFNVVM